MRLSARHAVVLLLAASACREGRPPAPAEGEEIFSVDPNEVLEVVLRLPGRRVEARRWATSEPFVFSFDRADGNFQRCPASAALDGSLRRLLTLTSRGTAPAAEARKLLEGQKSRWGELVIRDTIDAEPFRLRVLPPERDGDPLYATPPNAPWVVRLDGQTLAIAEAGCPVQATR